MPSTHLVPSELPPFVSRGRLYVESWWPLSQEGGLWINLGPLLYHWADSHLYMASPELSIEVRLNRTTLAHFGLEVTLKT